MNLMNYTPLYEIKTQVTLSCRNQALGGMGEIFGETLGEIRA
jgi:hypothetical protein